jgi:hypothetical protein
MDGDILMAAGVTMVGDMAAGVVVGTVAGMVVVIVKNVFKKK